MVSLRLLLLLCAFLSCATVASTLYATETKTHNILEESFLDKKPPEPEGQNNRPLEDFFVVSFVSLPFTAFWSLLGMTVVASVQQQTFPPDFEETNLLNTMAIAAGTSVFIGLVSVSWGHGKAPAEKVSTHGELKLP